MQKMQLEERQFNFWWGLGLLLAIALVAPFAFAQSNIGNVKAAAINTFYYPGVSPYIVSASDQRGVIQKAVTAACGSTVFAHSGVVVIFPGVTLTDVPTGVTGCTGVTIVDYATLPWTCFASTGGLYTSANCGTGSGGGVSFDQITSGTNLAHGLVCGAGCVLTPSGGGFVNANEINGGLPPTSTAVAGYDASGKPVGVPSQTSNLFFASPCATSGVPTFRLLCAGDIPAGFVRTAPTGSQTITQPAGTTFGVTGFKSFGGTYSTSAGIVAQYDTTQPVVFDGPGLSQGNGYQRVQMGYHQVIDFSARGITQGIEQEIYCNKVADCAAQYSYLHVVAGLVGADDEGNTGSTRQILQIPTNMHGTVTTGGTGATSLTLAFTAGHTKLIDGGFLLDTSRTQLSGSLTGGSTQVGSTYLYSLPVTGVTLPLTTAWGSATQAIVKPTNQNSGDTQSVVLTMTLMTIGAGTPAFATGKACMTGPNLNESINITVAGAASGTAQTITALVRDNNGAGGIIMQGGLCGKFLSFDDDLTAAGQYIPFRAVGSLTGTDLIYSFPVAGLVVRGVLPLTGISAETTTSAFHLIDGAEVVANPDNSFDNPQLEFNTIAWTAADNVVSTQLQLLDTLGDFVNCQLNSPVYSGSTCDSRILKGTGITAGFYGRITKNDNPYSQYTIGGGKLLLPTAHQVDGPFGDMFDFLHGPAVDTFGANSLFRVESTALNDVTPFKLFSLPYCPVHCDSGGGGRDANYVQFNPATNAYTFAQITGPAATWAGATATELGYSSGVTSPIQTQLNAKLTNPMTNLGDIIYGGASGVPTRLGGFTVAGTYNLCETATGSAVAPTWCLNAITKSATTHQFFTAYNAGTGVFTAAQPAYSDLSGVPAIGWSCQPGFGDGLNAITAGTYLTTTCYNDTGQTLTLTGIKCFADAGTPTLAVTNGAGTALLTGAVTCTTAFAAGTQSGTTTIASGDFLKFTFVDSASTKQATFVVTGNHP